MRPRGRARSGAISCSAGGSSGGVPSTMSASPPGKAPSALVRSASAVFPSAATASLIEEPIMSDTDVLFRPFKLKALSRPNRIVMAPMTRSKSPGQVPNDAVVAYYKARAAGGTGLILTEGTAPEHPAATNDANVPNFYGAAALAGWAKVLKAVESGRGRNLSQPRDPGHLRPLRNP